MDDICYLEKLGVGRLNLFIYCDNNPISGFDPNGHWNWGKFGIMALATVVLVTAVIASGGSALLVAAAATTGSVLTYAAAEEVTAVADLSVTIPIGKEGHTINVGFSLVLDFKEGDMEGYFHAGTGYGIGGGLTYSVGLIDNYDSPGDYGGHFVNGGINIGVGLEHCFDPTKPYNESVKATTVTFSNGFSAYVGYDYYWQIF